MVSKAEGFGSPERAALAAAIARLREHDADETARASAIATLETRRLNLSGERDKAEEAIGKAREAAVVHLLAAARGDAGAAPETVAQARARFEDLSEQYQALQQALVKLGEPRPGLGREFLASDVRRAAGAVMAGSTALAELHAEVSALAEEFVRKAGALAACGSMGVHPPAQQRGPSGEVYGAWYKGVMAMKDDRHPNPLAAEWAAALAALCADASAPVPGESVALPPGKRRAA